MEIKVNYLTEFLVIFIISMFERRLQVKMTTGVKLAVKIKLYKSPRQLQWNSKKTLVNFYTVSVPVNTFLCTKNEIAFCLIES